MPTIDELVVEVAALRRRVEASEAVLEIHSLKSRYADLVDRRFVRGRQEERSTLVQLAAEVAGLFTEDGTWDGGPGLGRATGRRAIADKLSSPTLDFSRHLFVKPDIRVDGDRASARWDLLSPCRRPEGTSFWMCGYEDDEYQRVDGVWLHHSMTLTTVFMAPVGEGWEKILA